MSRRSSPERAPASTASPSSRARHPRSSARSASPMPTRPTSSRSPMSPPLRRTWPRTASDWPSCGQTPSGRRSVPWPGAARRCSASTGSRRSADWPLTAQLPAPATAEAYDPATTWTLFAGGDILLDRGVYLTLKSKGANFAVRWRDRRHHRSLQGLLVDGLGPALHEADRECRRLPAPDQERRHRRRQLREPGAGQPSLPRLRNELLGRSPLHRRLGRGRDRLPVSWPTTTSATPAGPASSRRSRT